jgi:hypothetical protein
MLKGDSVVAKRVADALKNGVKVVACESTTKAMKLTYVDMLAGVGCVPAGVVELMRKPQQGYAGIRPRESSRCVKSPSRPLSAAGRACGRGRRDLR